MKLENVSYEIKHNNEDFFFPLSLNTLYNGEVIASESFKDLEEIMDKIKETDEELKKSSNENYVLDQSELDDLEDGLDYE